MQTPRGWFPRRGSQSTEGRSVDAQPRGDLVNPEDGHLLKCYLCKKLFVCKPRGGIIPLWCPRCIQLQANPERWN